MLKKRFILIVILTIVTPLLLLGITIFGLSIQKKTLDQIIEVNFKNYQYFVDINNYLLQANSSVYKMINQINAGKSEQDLKEDAKKTDNYFLEAISLSKAIYQLSRDEKDNQILALIEDYKKEHDSALPVILADVSLGAMMLMTVDKKYKAAADYGVERLNFLKDNVVAEGKKSSEYAAITRNLSILFSILSLIVCIAIILLVSRKLISLLTSISSELSTSSQETAITSNALSEASSTLSSTVEEQSAAITETTASLEEISGLLKTNLTSIENTHKMSISMKDESMTAQKRMTDLEDAMRGILQSNEEIKKLVEIIGNIAQKTKVMDEIVFQTKLLSFNASVEAERAGEHGRGFAVVAQEVGNLATMSGNAAREIADILKTSLTNAEAITETNQAKVAEGNEIVKMTAAVLSTITNSSITLTENAQQVLEASIEQEKGIEQINCAMLELDKSTNEITSLSSVSASSSQKLTDQSNSLKQIISSLQNLISGK